MFYKMGAEKWDGNWSECELHICFDKSWRNASIFVDGIEFIREGRLMTQERVGISAAMSLSEGSEMRPNYCPV